MNAALRSTMLIALALLAGAPAEAAGRRGAPVHSSAPAGARLAYVCELFSHSVSVIDLDRLEWLRDFAVGSYPVFSALAPHDSTRLLVTLHNYGREEDADALVAVDRASGEVLARVGYPGPGMPSGFVFDPKRDRLYVADENLHRIHVHDACTLAWLSDLPAGLVPVHVALSPDARWLVATDRKSADLYVFDLEKPRIEARDGIGVLRLGAAPRFGWAPGEADSATLSHPLDVQFARDTALCYVTDMSQDALLVVDLVRWAVVDRIRFDAAPFDFAIDRAGALAYVCLVGDDRVAVVDLATWRIVRHIAGLAPDPIHCALDEDRARLVVACYGEGKSGCVYVVDLKTDRTVARIAPAGAKGSIGITLAR
jgi:DNA-binding beta-propeller fold protein YncE